MPTLARLMERRDLSDEEFQAALKEHYRKLSLARQRGKHPPKKENQDKSKKVVKAQVAPLHLDALDEVMKKFGCSQAEAIRWAILKATGKI